MKFELNNSIRESSRIELGIEEEDLLIVYISNDVNKELDTFVLETLANISVSKSRIKVIMFWQTKAPEAEVLLKEIVKDVSKKVKRFSIDQTFRLIIETFTDETLNTMLNSADIVIHLGYDGKIIQKSLLCSRPTINSLMRFASYSEVISKNEHFLSSLNKLIDVSSYRRFLEENAIRNRKTIEEM